MTANARALKPQFAPQPRLLPAPNGDQNADNDNDNDSDIVIVGGGFAGSLAALMLGRRGFSPIVIDIHEAYPSDFRAETFSSEQLASLRDLDILSCFDADLSHTGMRYDAMVNALRRHWPEGVRFIAGNVQGLNITPEHQQVRLADGRVIDSRLIVLATGPGEKLRSGLGLQKYVLSAEHSICIGFTLKTDDPKGFPAAQLIEHGRKAGDGIGFANLFRLAPASGGLMRVNLFLYDDRNAERVRRFRQQPIEELFRALPRLQRRLPAVVLDGLVEVRVSDLYDITTPKLPGIVLIGDARRTSCPATGSGISRILNDVKDLSRTFAPVWLEGERRDASLISAFYTDETRRKLDADLHRRSENARRMALDSSPYWRVRRLISRLKAHAKNAPAPATAMPDDTTRFFSGDAVRVRRASEILATLDADGRCDGMPFMPEMAAFIGMPMRVYRRADRTCVEGHGLRRLNHSVFLENARCDGSAHGDCQRDCLMFWKEAWLRPADAPVPPRDDVAERKALLRLQGPQKPSGERFICQSTQLDNATQALSKMHLRAMLREVHEGEMPPREFLRLSVRAVINKLRHLSGRPEMGMLLGAPGEKSRGVLNLKPGDWVRIRDPEAIRATLSPSGRNLGLSFEPEMTRYAGQVRQVDQVIERIIHEETGDMVHLRQTVSLKGLYCQGFCAKACPRTNPLFWREIWLERVGGPET